MGLGQFEGTKYINLYIVSCFYNFSPLLLCVCCWMCVCRNTCLRVLHVRAGFFAHHTHCQQKSVRTMHRLTTHCCHSSTGLTPPPCNGPPTPLHPPTFSDVPVRRALEFPGAQEEAGPVVRVALAAGGRAEAPRGRAALFSQHLVDGGAVLVGQRRVGCGITILLGIWEKGGQRWGRGEKIRGEESRGPKRRRNIYNGAGSCGERVKMRKHERRKDRRKRGNMRGR